MPLAEGIGAHSGCSASGVAPGQALTRLRETWYQVSKPRRGQRLGFRAETCQRGWQMETSSRNWMPREGANPAVPKDGEEQGWEGQPWKETGFLSVVAQLPLGAFGRGEADL